MEQKLGVHRAHSTPSLALGTAAVTTLEMASVYADDRRGGVYSAADRDPAGRLPRQFRGRRLGPSAADGVIPDWSRHGGRACSRRTLLHGTGVGLHVTGTRRTQARRERPTTRRRPVLGYTPRLEAPTSGWATRGGEVPMTATCLGAAVSGPTLPATALADVNGGVSEKLARHSVPGDGRLRGSSRLGRALAYRIRRPVVVPIAS